jgi:hypothetical protein
MGFVGQALGLQWAFLMVGMAGIGSLIYLGFLKEVEGSEVRIEKGKSFGV